MATHTTFQDFLLTQIDVHEILEFEILSSEKHFYHGEISKILFHVRDLDPCKFGVQIQRNRHNWHTNKVQTRFVQISYAETNVQTLGRIWTKSHNSGDGFPTYFSTLNVQRTIRRVQNKSANTRTSLRWNGAIDSLLRQFSCWTNSDCFFLNNIFQQ